LGERAQNRKFNQDRKKIGRKNKFIYNPGSRLLRKNGREGKRKIKSLAKLEETMLLFSTQGVGKLAKATQVQKSPKRLTPLFRRDERKV